MSEDRNRAQIRRAAQVIFGAMVLWMLGSWAGGALGIAPRFAFLLDMACLAALFWAFVVLIRAWMRMREE